MSKSQKPKPDIRYLNDIKDVLFDQKWAKTAPNFELYYMYRNIIPSPRLVRLGRKNSEIRYDETLIPPRLLGGEFVKTKGHYHIGKFGEIYQVLEGEAIFLFQKNKTGRIEDVYYIKAKKGDFISIMQDYGHITINPSKKVLKIGNWLSKKCKSDYESVERKNGFCYYYTKQGWVKNNAYKKIPKLRFEKPQKSMPKNLKFIYGN